MKPLNLPIKTRLALVFVCLLAVVLVVAGLLLRQGFAAQLDRVIDGDLASLAEEFVADLNDGETLVLHDFEISEPDPYFAQIIDPVGRVIENSRTSDSPLIDRATRGVDTTTTLQNEVAPHLGGMAASRMAAALADDGTLVLVGRTLAERDATLGNFGRLLLLFGPAILIVVGALGWVLAAAALRPVEELRRAASRISESDRASHLVVPPSGDEIALLATTLNEMLARLHAGLERERRIIDDASHELRTPLAILRTELDLALRKARTADELRAALVSAAEISERLIRLANDMLVFARTNRGTLPLQKTPQDLSRIVSDAVSLFRNRADAAEIALALDLPPSLPAILDETRIRQAIENLMENAIFHSSPGGVVSVKACAEGSRRLTVSVADTGRGFPPDFLPMAFDPYTRSDVGRSRRHGGAGLGLAIVRSLVEAHGGTVEAANLPEGGAVVRFWLPVQADAAG